MNVRQCFILILIILPAFKLTMLPGYLAAEIGRDAYLAVGLAMLVDLVALAAILAINRKGGLQNVLRRLIGRTGATIVCVLILVFMTAKLALQVQDPLHYMTNMLFDHNEKVAIILPLALTAGYVGYKSARSLGRLAEMLCLLLVVPAIISFAFSRAPADFGYLSPVLGKGVGMLGKIKGVAVWFGDYLPLLFVRLDENSEKKSGWLMLAGVMGTAFTMGVFATFTAVYQGAAGYIPDALSKLARFNVLGSEVGRIDMLAILAWLFAVILHASLVVNAISRAMSDTWKTKGKIALVAVSGTVFFVLTLIVGGEETVYAAADALFWPVVVFNLIVPIVGLACGLISGVRRSRNEKARMA